MHKKSSILKCRPNRSITWPVVCVGPIRRERQLLSPRRINDTATRAAVTPETGRMRSRSGGKKNSSDWVTGTVLIEKYMTDSGRIISLFKFSSVHLKPVWLIYVVLRDWLFSVPNSLSLRQNDHDCSDYETAPEGALGPDWVFFRFEQYVPRRYEFNVRLLDFWSAQNISGGWSFHGYVCSMEIHVSWFIQVDPVLDAGVSRYSEIRQ